MKYDFYLDMGERRSHTLLLRKVQPGSVVLELGCSTGIMTNYLKNTLNCRVYVCEIDEASIQIARLYADGSWQGDLDGMGWADFFGAMRFDYILCADVLEHLRDPEGVLQKTAGLLKEDGSLLLSMPNVAHNSVVFDLLDNRFEYTEVGILDKTHLKFYTYPSLKRLCAEAGYTPVEEDAIYQEYLPPSAEKYPDFIKLRKYGHVFQFIFELKKTEYALEHKIEPVNRIEEYPPQRG